jgi:MFS transporter, BCD family, chlorophyll transporter
LDDDVNLPIGRNIKIGFFHLGSGMVDVLITGIWNRIMISDLGFAATPIALLTGLRYFLAPLGIWVGRTSDRRAIGGYRRLFWIWLGRAMMVISVLILGLQTTSLVRGQEVNFSVWFSLLFAMLLFSLGNAISGSTFLALIYDRSNEDQRGRAVGIVWTFLLLGFATGGMFFSSMLPEQSVSSATISSQTQSADYGSNLSFTPEALQNLFLVTGLLLAGVWFLSLLGEEKRVGANVPDNQNDNQAKASLMGELKVVWQYRSLRFFLFYLTLSMIFAFSQDPILEPFGGDVFDMSAQETTKFAAYWGSMSIFGTMACLWLSRRYRILTNTIIAYTGVAVLFVTFTLFIVSGVFEIRELFIPSLILLGLGLGIWNVGTLGLMMRLSPPRQAGTFLGVWSLAVMFGRGIGLSGGGIIRDAALHLTGNINVSYVAVFFVGSIGLCVSTYCLKQVDVGVPKEAETPEQATVHAILSEALD